jgi:hypothetical protein
MKSKSLLLITTLTILIFLAVAFILLPGEPSYQGLTLSRWLDIACPLSGNTSQQQAEADHAIRQMRPKALPMLVTWFKAKDGEFDRWFSAKVYPMLMAFSVAHWVHWRPVADRNIKSIWGFKALGSAANPAIPDLLAFIHSSTNVSDAWRGVRALSAIGSEQALDAAMSLQDRRPYFSREALLSAFRTFKPRLPEYVWKKYEWGYPRKLGPRKLQQLPPGAAVSA